MTRQELSHLILKVRYPRSENKYLEEYLINFGSDKESILFLLAKLRDLIAKPIVWEGYSLSSRLISNAEFFKKETIKVINKFQNSSLISAPSVREFFLNNHASIKYAIGRWLIINAGIAIELFNLSEEKVEANFLRELLKKGLKINDEVVHMHIVSNRERIYLKELGFKVPYLHWDKSYYVDALKVIDRLLQSKQESLGLFCEDSWVFDPGIHKNASDGKPYASFNFLADDKLVGERFFVGEAKPDNQYYKQYEFSLRSPRRLRLHQQGEFIPKTYGIYYPKELLHNNIKTILANPHP